MDRYLKGVWTMIEAGVPPSNAIVACVPAYALPGVADYLAIRSLECLDTMTETRLRRLLGHTAV